MYKLTFSKLHMC